MRKASTATRGSQGTCAVPEIVEDCKAKFEERLQGKSENIVKELEKLNLRVKELEDLGEMKNIQQYTYEVRLLQNKLKSIEQILVFRGRCQVEYFNRAI